MFLQAVVKNIHLGTIEKLLLGGGLLGDGHPYLTISQRGHPDFANLADWGAQTLPNTNYQNKKLK